MQFIFLSHDVDWRRQGPPMDHIMARKDRFEKEVFENTSIKNPYYNIPEYMDIEKNLGVKSTFFFRTKYENGDFRDYQEDIKSLISGGWEIGLHSDPSSIDSFEKLENEKKNLEELTKNRIAGNRVHYLGFNDELPKKLHELGFTYDSTIRHSKDKIDKNEMGFFKFGQLIEFPVTLMDAYLFTYMRLNEEQLVPEFEKTLNYGRDLNPDFNVITVIWHDNVLKMKGGRMYKKILEFLVSQDDVRICRGIDLATTIQNQLES